MELKTSITKITFQGFKSFNKRVSIPLLPGFNVIAGPNGSGKSNIIDAIIFVIGKKSAKSLRADRLHELIFHGDGSERAKSDYASVTLFLDNTKKVFPFDDEEISIMRRVNKKGVSTYKLNGKTTTREKVLQVIGAARIKPDGHNIVMQGDITQIIEMNPRERRFVLDDISGIADYNDKKEKAEKDLESVDQKLKEAEIIITQRYDLFKKLEAEKNSATKYQELDKRLLVLKASYARKNFDTFEEQMNKIDEKLAAAEEENKVVSEEIAEIEKELDKSEAAIRKIADKVVDISKSVKLEKEVSEMRAKIMVTKDKIAANETQIERLDSLVEKLRSIENSRAEFTGEMPRAVKTILEMKIKGVHGTISKLIEVPSEYKLAIEVAAGPHINDIIVEDESVASTCIEFLKKEKIGRATFLPLNKIKPNFFRDMDILNEKGVHGISSKLIRYDTKYMSAMEFVFGSTLIVDDLETAKDVGIGKARMVSLEGDLAERSGAMIGGHSSRMHAKSIQASSKNEVERYAGNKTELEQETNLLRKELEELEKRISNFNMSDTTKEFVELEKDRAGSEGSVDKLREKRKIAHEKKVNSEIRVNKFKIQKARLEAEVDMSKAELEKFETNIEYLDDSLSSLQTQIKKTEKEIAILGPVNMKSIEDFEKLKTEFDGYKEKYDKILEEKKAVVEMIEEIETKRKETFRKTLDIVAKEFNDIFVKMAKGTSEIVLENPEDIESGLLIKASPRGKMLLNIDSMSGGEKTLTAMAFILAIQRYQPTAFYVFDEVDAALDKDNSRQIAKMLKMESEKSQFIMITHNDETIKIGDRVYGVTMDKGETKVLGLELPKN